ncbi:MAG: hydrolase, partial [Bacteroidota bacterium]
MRKPTLLLALFFISFGATAQDSTQVVPKKIYITKPVAENEPPSIDGLLNDLVWDTVDWTGDYVELQPDENTPPSYQTKFKIVYDSKYLYIGVRCYDAEPDKIVRRLSRRDGFDGDWVEF